jgi:hypothetical protein
MGSFESFPLQVTPEEELLARNSLQLKAMADFHETPEEWIETGDAEIAARIFEEEPALLKGYFMFKNDPVKLEEIIKQFEKLIENHRTVSH